MRSRLMPVKNHRKRVAGLWAMLVIGTLTTGCHCCGPLCDACPFDDRQPRELSKVSLPAYIIEPPDILQIDAIRLVPLPPYRLDPLDALIIQVVGTRPNEPILGIFSIAPEGTVNLGATYGTVRVVGLTVEEAQKEIMAYLGKQLKEPQ